eukprot:XP_011667073.1 PREDICTED: uncharacterized protein LOC105439597 [Strongylocentrotus purpuratus]
MANDTMLTINSFCITIRYPMSSFCCCIATSSYVTSEWTQHQQKCSLSSGLVRSTSKSSSSIHHRNGPKMYLGQLKGSKGHLGSESDGPVHSTVPLVLQGPKTCRPSSVYDKKNVDRSVFNFLGICTVIHASQPLP